MKVSIKNKRDGISDKDYEILVKFLKFLQKELPVKNDVELSFIQKREGSMTTGVRKPNGVIHVLSKNRMLIDVMRTIAHEWVHEYQHQILGIAKKNKKIKDIGGPEENMANVLSGIFIKKFQKSNPQFESQMYGE